LLVALYALCLVTPTAVIAAFDAASAHCITDKNHGQADHPASHEMGQDHHGNDGSNHPSDSGDGEKGQAGKCCGVFCVSAISPAGEGWDWRHPPAAHVASLFVASLSGQDSDRIDRPPRFLLSL